MWCSSRWSMSTSSASRRSGLLPMAAIPTMLWRLGAAPRVGRRAPHAPSAHPQPAAAARARSERPCPCTWRVRPCYRRRGLVRASVLYVCVIAGVREDTALLSGCWSVEEAILPPRAPATRCAVSAACRSVRACVAQDKERVLRRGGRCRVNAAVRRDGVLPSAAVQCGAGG